jgi:long-chain acyl-CoA synthetase
MTYPGVFAATTPDKPAVICADTGEQVSYAELNDRSIRFANLLVSLGLEAGDTFAVLAENNVRYFELYWAALRAGLYITPVNWHLAPEEIAYQVTDSGSKVLVTTAALAQAAQAALNLIGRPVHALMIGGTADGFGSYEEAIACASPVPPQRQPRGDAMLYSSGTTGRPKGIKRALRGTEVDDPAGAIAPLRMAPGVGPSVVYLNSAPIYHGAPLFWTTSVHSFGGTVVITQKFDPEQFLGAIEDYGVTHTQVVPTMMVRILKLPPGQRAARNLSTLKALVHAAAPCPPDVKEQFIDWLGPVVYEYYTATEGIGLTWITSQEWLAHRGSVGKAVVGVPHICDELGNEVPAGTAGTLYFEQPNAAFSYHGDEHKTRDSRHPQHSNWSTVGDMGYLDPDGYLYLTDRQSFMIISGGVNIYPAEIENRLIMHDKVADVAVFGLPDPEMGEFVQAVVQLAPGVETSPELADELRAFVRERLAGYKVPRRIDFRAELPRLEAGKLAKYLLRREYLAASGAPG